jgi:1-deoxy-D-xylulose-5-phosphate reductoisomerase
MNRGGNKPCVLNAANEVVNQAFRDGKCGFLQMSDVIANTMELITFIPEPTYDDYVQTDNEARKIAMKLLKL